MRVTLDTNVLVSAFISKRGVPAEILDFIATFEEVHLVLSEGILEEFSSVMKRTEVRERFGYSQQQIAKFRQAIRDVAEIVEVESELALVKDDPADDIVVNTAIDGRVDYVVSGDRHLLKLERFRGTVFVSPREFLRVLGREFGEMILKGTDEKES